MMCLVWFGLVLVQTKFGSANQVKSKKKLNQCRFEFTYTIKHLSLPKFPLSNGFKCAYQEVYF